MRTGGAGYTASWTALVPLSVLWSSSALSEIEYPKPWARHSVRSLARDVRRLPTTTPGAAPCRVGGAGSARWKTSDERLAGRAADVGSRGADGPPHQSSGGPSNGFAIHAWRGEGGGGSGYLRRGSMPHSMPLGHGGGNGCRADPARALTADDPACTGGGDRKPNRWARTVASRVSSSACSALWLRHLHRSRRSCMRWRCARMPSLA